MLSELNTPERKQEENKLDWILALGLRIVAF
jgi:hypothetical protein